MECHKVRNITGKYLSCYKTEVFSSFNCIIAKKNLCTSRISASGLTNNFTNAACTLNVFINVGKATNTSNINALINIFASSFKNSYGINAFILCISKVSCSFSISNSRIHDCIYNLSDTHANLTL